MPHSSRTHSHPAAKYAGWSVHCAACGSCCNSAPLLSLPEAFRHQEIFVGTLGLRRVRRVRTGGTLGRGSAGGQASEEDRVALDKIAAHCLHPLPAEGRPDYDLLLAPLGFDDPGLGRCPALGEDGRCTIHSRHKPVVCSAVPFDPLMPDRLQHLVLAERWAQSDDLHARCIARTADSERMAVQGARLRDDDARRVLAAARRALAADKRCWGNAIFAELAAHFLAEAGSAERIPTEGFLVIPLTPVLELLAGISARCRQRCLEYLDAQIVLCETTAQACLLRKQPSVGASLVRLRGFARSYHVLRSALLARQPEPVASPGLAGSDVEAWLEQAQPEVSPLLGGGPAA